MEQIRIEILPLECDEDGCANGVWRKLKTYEPDTIGPVVRNLCRKHVLAHRDILRAMGQQHGIEVVES